MNDKGPFHAPSQGSRFREKVWEIIFRHDTPGSKLYDVVLMVLISASVLIIMLESVQDIGSRHRSLFVQIEWGFTILFTLEYFIRIWSVRRPSRYIFSFFGIIDLFSVLPTYLAWLISGAGAQYMVVIRILRLLRMFRVLKMMHHVSEANILLNALAASRGKITIFSVLAVTAILGTMMYVVEGMFYQNPGFANIPEAIYWAIVTISTVGYGDVTPISPLGKLISTVIMLLGFGIIAVPTGIVTAELNMQFTRNRTDDRVCPSCGSEGHEAQASHCKMCGEKL